MEAGGSVQGLNWPFIVGKPPVLSVDARSYRRKGNGSGSPPLRGILCVRVGRAVSDAMYVENSRSNCLKYILACLFSLRIRMRAALLGENGGVRRTLISANGEELT